MIAQHEKNWAQDVTSAWKILATNIFPVRKKKPQNTKIGKLFIKWEKLH